MASARKYAVICDGKRVLSGASFAQANRMYENMMLAFSFVDLVRARDKLDFQMPALVLCVDM